MSRMIDMLRKETGASLVEYALIASLIALPSVATMNAISDTMNEEFNSIEDNAASAGHGTTTTAGATPTTAGGGATPTTTATTSAPPSTTSTTTTTTTTTVPAATTSTSTTTTTTAVPPPTTAPPAPVYQTETANTDGGWLEFELDDGEIRLNDYDLRRGWRGQMTRNPDGSLTVHLWQRSGRGEVWAHAYVDSNGNLIVTVS